MRTFGLGMEVQQTCKKSFFRKGYGFTLIELLVVVAIIAVLVAMLLPALNSAREQAKITVCSANQNQLSKVLGYYSNDYGDWLCPPVSTYLPNNDPELPLPYPALLYEYLNDSLIVDPKDESISKVQRIWSPITGNYQQDGSGDGKTILQCPSNPNPMKYTWSVHYGMNNMTWLGANSYYAGLGMTNWNKLSQVVQPSKVYYVLESDASMMGGLYGNRVQNNILVLGKWHKDGTVVMYYDGHVDYKSYEEISYLCTLAPSGVPWYSKD